MSNRHRPRVKTRDDSEDFQPGFRKAGESASSVPLPIMRETLSYKTKIVCRCAGAGRLRRLTDVNGTHPTIRARRTLARAGGVCPGVAAPVCAVWTPTVILYTLVTTWTSGASQKHPLHPRTGAFNIPQNLGAASDGASADERMAVAALELMVRRRLASEEDHRASEASPAVRAAEAAIRELNARPLSAPTPQEASAWRTKDGVSLGNYLNWKTFNYIRTWAWGVHVSDH
ncbi:hypothetical protein B0H14DRAFT_3540256 [Mycena olivaceomarginata]|nr:hypothetical protein B0H14DRAFT_3540256 [Mycena olivaceomarginata]